MKREIKRRERERESGNLKSVPCGFWVVGNCMDSKMAAAGLGTLFRHSSEEREERDKGRLYRRYKIEFLILMREMHYQQN